MTAATQQSYTVKGMTCDHCRASVTAEVEQVRGVTGIDADPGTGRLTVSGRDISDEAIRAAIDDAGYDVVSP